MGELGFEIYINVNDAKKIYQLIVDEGKNYDLSHCGSHAMDTMRMESGFYIGDMIYLLKKINMKQD